MNLMDSTRYTLKMGGIVMVQNSLSLPQNTARDIGRLVVVKLLPDVWAKECGPLIQKVEELDFYWTCLSTPIYCYIRDRGLNI